MRKEKVVQHTTKEENNTHTQIVSLIKHEHTCDEDQLTLIHTPFSQITVKLQNLRDTAITQHISKC